MGIGRRDLYITIRVYIHESQNRAWRKLPSPRQQVTVQNEKYNMSG